MKSIFHLTKPSWNNRPLDGGAGARKREGVTMQTILRVIAILVFVTAAGFEKAKRSNKTSATCEAAACEGLKEHVSRVDING
jgi:hypothetical protein